MTEAKTSVLDLPCGPIIVCHEGDIVHARGIPYATADRFKRPVPATWSVDCDCTRPATICPQNPSRLAVVNGDITAGRIQSEDCMHVTIAAPAHAKSLPVMVFFHGGAYLSGGGDLDAYSPCPLARAGVVAVTVTSRLSHFGYLPIPDIAPSNLGLLDQIEALRWVQRNISNFGGDVSNVTIHGQSAGGDSVFCILVSKQARGLFHRAIIQSAPMGRFEEPESLREQMTMAMGEVAGKALRSTGNDGLSTQDYLHLQPQIMAAGRQIHSSLLTFAPVFGQDPLPPCSELEQCIKDAAKRVPIMIGYTADEGAPFTTFDSDPEHTADWYSRIVFQNGTDKLHGRVCEAVGKENAPFYNFVWHPEGSRWGASHCIELPFLLGGAKGWHDAPMLEGCDKNEVIETLGRQVKALWIAFASGKNLGGVRFEISSDFVFKG